MLDALLEARGRADGPRTVGRLIQEIAARFRQSGIQSANLDARMLVAEACGISTEDTIVQRDSVFPAAALPRVEAYAVRRLNREPVSRIVGRREFWGLSFEISPDTLDPRPETELLVEAVLEHAKLKGWVNRPLQILDLGTGSGCLLCALLSELPLSYGVGVDCSTAALFVARKNLSQMGLRDRAALLCADWASALAGGSFDIVVSNPPYLGDSEIEGLTQEVAAYDPRKALDGGVDGLEAYRKLIGPSLACLKDEGILVVEIAPHQACAVRDMMTSASELLEIRILADLAGRSRAVAGVRQLAWQERGSKKKIGNPALSG
ncbi:MAG TPA: peptide chain release factor N(5)-glutamine methyltransferase [Hyphomicrobiales bacterium]|nr:peptide chain release factor N(5)-glutamine methyltransferase [Hyphomicrobiales bacterium]